MLRRNFIHTFAMTSFLFLCCVRQLSGVEQQPRPIATDFSLVTDPTQAITDELEMLDALIEVTAQNLEKQIALKERIKQYQRIQQEYLRDTENKELTYKMIKSAHRILESIKENHLTQAFDPEFLNELTLFSQIATKRGIPKP